MVHSFTCAGIIPSQYIHLSTFAGLGTVGHAYIRRGIYCTKTCTSLTFSFTVYNKNSYLEIVAENSMQSAVEELCQTTALREKYVIILFQWVITDARHDSTANALPFRSV